MSLLRRLGEIARAEIGTRIEAKFGKRRHREPAFDFEDIGDPAGPSTDSRDSGLPAQVVEDLSVFGLTPPASWDSVKTARNREVKKYHADRFQHDPEKLETATQIMQIMNTAFERLEKYYDQHPEADPTRMRSP